MSPTQGTPEEPGGGVAGWRDGDGRPPTHFVVDAALQVSHGGPALLLLHLGVVVQDLVPQPGQVVDAQLVLLSCHTITPFANDLLKRLQL